MYPFALNTAKLERAIKLAESDDPQDVYEKYVLLAGKVDASNIPGAKKEKSTPKNNIEKPHVIPEPVSAFTTLASKLTNKQEKSEQDTSHTTG